LVVDKIQKAIFFGQTIKCDGRFILKEVIILKEATHEVAFCLSL
jgi:hypothetical protein